MRTKKWNPWLVWTGLAALTTILTSGNLLAGVASPDVLIYKVVSSRNAVVDQVFNMGATNQAPRATRTGLVTQTEYWVLDRNTQDLVVVPYSRKTGNNFGSRVYQIQSKKYKLFNGTLPTTEHFESQTVLSPRTGRSTVTWRNNQIFEASSGSGVTEGCSDVTQGVFYLVGDATTVQFWWASVSGTGSVAKGVVQVPKVARVLRGQHIMTRIVSNDITSYAPARSDFFQRENGSITATLDVALTNSCLGVVPPTGSGLQIGTLSYGTSLVQKALERLGYENTTPAAPAL